MSADCIFPYRNHPLLGMHRRLCHRYHTLPTMVLVKQFRQRAMSHFQGGREGAHVQYLSKETNGQDVE